MIRLEDGTLTSRDGIKDSVVWEELVLGCA